MCAISRYTKNILQRYGLLSFTWCPPPNYTYLLNHIFLMTFNFNDMYIFYTVVYCIRGHKMPFVAFKANSECHSSYICTKTWVNLYSEYFLIKTKLLYIKVFYAPYNILLLQKENFAKYWIMISHCHSFVNSTLKYIFLDYNNSTL